MLVLVFPGLFRIDAKLGIGAVVCLELSGAWLGRGSAGSGSLRVSVGMMVQPELLVVGLLYESEVGHTDRSDRTCRKQSV